MLLNVSSLRFGICLQVEFSSVLLASLASLASLGFFEHAQPFFPPRMFPFLAEPPKAQARGMGCMGVAGLKVFTSSFWKRH